jgi:putative membrane-bound dehydrogenase-like protein
MLAKVEPLAKSPQASLKSLQARPGFEVQLVASEPQVMDPVAFAFGVDGKLWVVEMGDYPLGLTGKNDPGGRVRYLEDRDGDGFYEKSTLFLDKLNYPTGVLPWRKGVIVISAPEIFYAEDTEGDGKADKREVGYSGFTRGNPQHLVNSLVLGLDNWIYCANGDSGGKIKSAKTGKVIDISGRDFRIRPDTGEIEAETGQTQFGRSRDDWGNWFGCNNPNPMYHFVLPDHYLRRNPHVAPPRPAHHVPKIPSVGPVYPISRTLERFNDPHTLNRFTSANSVIVYRDDLFGPHFEGNMFVSEPVHNLVHREVMMPVGVTFTCDRAPDEQKSEFLASSDNWFRPTMLQTGPDGALWVADMYRQVIEHPEWIPRGTKAKLDLRKGSDMGRIYRVFPVGSPPRKIPRLDKLDTAGLVAALDSPSGWQRDQAQRLLLEQKDESAIPLLRAMAAKNQRPQARLHALCALDGFEALDDKTLARAIDDEHAGVRRHAVRISERHFDKMPLLAALAAKLVNDPDPQVRLQLACSLGEWSAAESGVSLGHLALRDPNDRFMTAAVLSSVNARNIAPIARTVLSADKTNVPPALLEPLLKLTVTFGEGQVMGEFLARLTAPAPDGEYGPAQFAGLGRLLDGLDASKVTLLGLSQSADPRLAQALSRAQEIITAARRTVRDAKAAPQDRIAAIRLLGRDLEGRNEDIGQLALLLSPQTPQDVQAAAIEGLARMKGDDVPAMLLRGWKSHSLALRNLILDVLLGRNEWTALLVTALEDSRIAPADVDAARRQRLFQHSSRTIRQRAEKLFADAINPDRQKVLDAYSAAFTATGDAKRGAEVFTKTCATCHKIGAIGQHVGPDMAGIADKSPQSLLIAILDPNRAVEAKFTNFVAETRGGEVFTGIIASETGTSLTMISADGKPHTILRDQLKSLRSTGTSLMPENLESGYSPQDMADLIAFIRTTNPPARKKFEGNNPELVRAGANKLLRLTPANCEIYGSTVVLEKLHANLGYWTSEDDHAVWTIEVPAAGKYGVWLEWACAADSAGNAYVLEIGKRRITGRVAATGTWDIYHRAEISEIDLEPGKHQVILRSAGEISGALLDLKSIELVPPMARDF